ncbi:condensation domain-containing protein [Catelliglobosispora koreensis]|uniref:condensation domain-containing protein n=1 Tax=Catelliglobosispora koreensis TaxID=129052 RepID=UPI000378616B|nr:condensation domain-containing protein [Catelliglobosispora koreensis]
MVQRIRVEFKGEGSGEEELSWGQWAQWGAIQADKGRVLSAGGMMPLAAGTTEQELAYLLSFIMSRHETLRTTLRFEDGVPRQVVHESGELDIEVYDAGEGEDPADLAKEINDRYEAQGWELEHGWPVRWAIVRKDGVPAHFVALYNHFVIDAYGFEALIADLPNMDKETGRQLAPVPGLQPRDQVAKQRTPNALRQGAASLRHWEQQLRTIPLTQFPQQPQPQSPRWWRATFTSRAAFLAMEVIAQRTKVHTGTVILAAYAKALADVTGVNTSVIRILVSNRFRPGLKDSVSSVAQSALCVVETEQENFDLVVDSAFRSQVAAGTHAYYDPRELWKLIAKVGQERGSEPEMRCYYNDRRRSMAAGVEITQVATKEEVIAALAESKLQWEPPSDNPSAVAFLLVNGVPDVLDYTLIGDTQRLSPADMEACMRGLETSLIHGAFGDK